MKHIIKCEDTDLSIELIGSIKRIVLSDETDGSLATMTAEQAEELAISLLDLAITVRNGSSPVARIYRSKKEN